MGGADLQKTGGTDQDTDVIIKMGCLHMSDIYIKYSFKKTQTPCI